jgi:hypothetical protein
MSCMNLRVHVNANSGNDVERCGSFEKFAVLYGVIIMRFVYLFCYDMIAPVKLLLKLPRFTTSLLRFFFFFY